MRALVAGPVGPWVRLPFYVPNVMGVLAYAHDRLARGGVTTASPEVPAVLDMVRLVLADITGMRMPADAHHTRLLKAAQDLQIEVDEAAEKLVKSTVHVQSQLTGLRARLQDHLELMEDRGAEIGGGVL